MMTFLGKSFVQFERRILPAFRASDFFFNFGCFCGSGVCKTIQILTQELLHHFVEEEENKLLLMKVHML